MTIAPAYTITCTAARKSADWLTNSTATPKRVRTSDSAEWTGLRDMTTPTAPARMATPATTKTIQSG